jgi:Flp pilus assembly protein TadG
MVRSYRRPENGRRGVVAVEAAVALPLLLILMLGIWEVGRIIHVHQILVNGAREGARLAAGGYVDGTPVTKPLVENAVRDYLQAAGLPAAAVSGAQIDLVSLATPSWTDPSDAIPLDRFQVQVTIPPGPAFESLRWSFVTRLTSTNQMTAVVEWVSLMNTEVTVDNQLPL